MWVHIAVLAAGLLIAIGWKKGWIPSNMTLDKKGKRLFLLIVFGGNFLGAVLTVTKGGGENCGKEFRMERTVDGSYDQSFIVSVDGGKKSSLSVQIPEKETEEEQVENVTESVAKQKESERQAILDAVVQYNQDKNDPDYYYLPETWNGKTLQWQKERDTSGELLAALCLAAAFSVMILQMREEQEKVLKRREQLLMDYPGLIMKFTLLIQAGMTSRKAFRKMAMDYQRKKQKKARAAYEEIMVVCREMESGVSEYEAYRRFGERCDQVKYKTFSTLLIQNLQKGSKNLADLLEKESMEAWDERKRKARVMGEAAATKLLLPMVMMLLVVMAVVMIPALLSFYG